MTLLEAVVDALHATDIRFALIGATAMAVHGVARSTLDLDLLVGDRRLLQAGFWASLARPDAAVQLYEGDADDPLAGVARIQAPGERHVDIIVGRAAWKERVIARAVRVPIEGVELPVARAADLILLKLYAAGSQDAWDIQQLLAGESRAALVREVEAEIADLPAPALALWSKILQA